MSVFYSFPSYVETVFFFSKILSTWLVYWRWGIWFFFWPGVGILVYFVHLVAWFAHSIIVSFWCRVYLGFGHFGSLYSLSVCLVSLGLDWKGKGKRGFRCSCSSYLFCSGPVWCDTLVWDWVKRICHFYSFILFIRVCRLGAQVGGWNISTLHYIYVLYFT